MKKISQRGFTLIELSIVLVIIGLIVGGIVAGKDMIRAAELRALLSQKDKFTIAVNTFKIKYNAIPGDMRVTDAAKFGFFTLTGPSVGVGGNYGDGGEKVRMGLYWTVEWACNSECGIFWRHLSDAQLMEGSYGATLVADTTLGTVSGTPPSLGGGAVNVDQSLYMPKAKIGKGFFGAANLLDVAHFSDENTFAALVSGMDNTKNIFFLGLKGAAARTYFTEPTLSAVESYSLDLKIDDGKPNSGKFLVSTLEYYDYVFYWANSVNASSNVCTYGGADQYDTTAQYNANKGTGGNNITCIPVFVW